MGDLQCDKRTGSLKISIGIVIYNGIEHIKNALDSIVRQSYRNVELIIVDGGSTDGTLDILSQYADHISVLVSEPDKGIYDAMNKVCSMATGDWLIFLGCDDVLLDSFVPISELMIDKNSVYYGDVVKRSSCKFYGGQFSKYRLLQHNICHQAIFYPRTIYESYRYNLTYKLLADYAYNLMLIGNHFKFIYLGVVISIYNEKGASSQNVDENFARDRVSLLRASFGRGYLLIYNLHNLREWKDRFHLDLIIALKRLLPSFCWKLLQLLYWYFHK